MVSPRNKQPGRKSSQVLWLSVRIDVRKVATLKQADATNW